MNIKRPAAVVLLLLSTVLTTTTFAQHKRQTPAKTQPKATPAPTPAPTFDTLVPADSYAIYGEVRGVGQLIQSSAFNDFLEPILKLAGPPKEFKTMVKWLNAHADELMTSRLLVATWPTGQDIPDTIVAIEFASAEEAAKFATPLNEFLPTVVPEKSPESIDETDKSAPGEKSKPAATPQPSFHLERVGSLILLGPKPLKLKKPKPGKLLMEDVNFRAARNRFNSEPVFVFIDIKGIERQDEERRKHYEQVQREEADKVKAEQAASGEESTKGDDPSKDEPTEEEKARLIAEDMAALEAVPSSEPTKETPTPDPVSMVLNGLTSSFFGGGKAEMPEGIGLALSLENDSFDLRALLVNQPGEKSDTIPFFPMVIPGGALVPESPNILPADTELFITMSLDLPQIYSTMSRPVPRWQAYNNRGSVATVSEVEVESPFASLEKQLKINIKDDLLPLLGSEIAIGLPVNDMSVLRLGLGLAPPPAQNSKSSTKQTSEEQPKPAAGPVIATSVKDRDGLKALIPKLLDSMGLKGASSLAQTERREDTELVSFANMFAYAFVGNFLVLSGDPATTRYVVDSYLKHETLSSQSEFRSFTRWQPKPLQGQVYVSPALMEGYRTWAESPTTRVSDQTRAFLTRLSLVAQPITYSLSNEGIGPLHELHLPKNLVLLAVAGISGETNPPPAIQNERMAVGLIHAIGYSEEEYKKAKGSGSYGTLEQLIAAELVSKESLDRSGYKFDVILNGDKFEVSAVPVEYGKTGSLSYFMDHTRVLRGGDRNGASATSSDPPIN